MPPSRRTRRSGAIRPPKDVVLETIADLRRNAPGVMAQAVQGKAMPLGNETGMTDAERAALGAFLAQR